MRIDVENGIVWCNQEMLDWHNSFECNILRGETRKKEAMIYRISRVGYGYLLTDYRENEVSCESWKDVPTLELIQAIIRGYTFKLETPKVYYWRKLEKHLAFFEKEKQNSMYLTLNIESGKLLLSSSHENGYYRTTFTVEEAKKLLKDDFDKFERISDYDKTI